MNKKYLKRKRRESGVVLLTCLVFLLILLAMLRFTISSARIEEQKAAIDLEIVSAKEAAQAALNYAEYYILWHGQKACEAAGGTQCIEDAASYANQLFSGDHTSLSNVNFSDAAEGIPANMSLSSILGNGFYTGTFITPRTSAGQCQPLWVCVKWPSAAHSVIAAASEQRISGTVNLEAIECPVNQCAINSRADHRPRFIIERFTADELGQSQLNNAVVLRVTAVGFGVGSGGAGAYNAVTNAMLQAVYVIPRSTGA